MPAFHRAYAKLEDAKGNISALKSAKDSICELATQYMAELIYEAKKAFPVIKS